MTKKQIQKIPLLTWLIFLGAMGMAILINIDYSIVNLAIAKIAAYFHVSISQAGWLINAFNLTCMAVMVFFGRLADIIGKKTIYLFAIVIFGLGLVLAAAAWNIWVLIIGRGLQGLGAGAAFALGIVIINEIFPKEKLGFALGCYTTIIGLAQALGPTSGGVILQYLSWRWLFIINIPIALIAWFFIQKFYNPEKTKKEEKIDYIGFVILAVMVTFIMLAFNGMAAWGIANIKIVLLLISSLVLIVAFYWRENKAKHPLIDFEIFKQKVYVLCVMMRFLTAGCWVVLLFIIPLYLQNIRGISPFATGIIVFMYPLSYIVCSPFIGKFADRIGFNWITFIASVMLLGCMLCFLWIGSDYYIVWSILIYILLGFNTSCMATGASGLSVRALPTKSKNVGMGVFYMMVLLGASIFIALSTLILKRGSQSFLARLLLKIKSLTVLQISFLDHAVTGTRSIHQIAATFPSQSSITIQTIIQQSFIHGMQYIAYAGFIIALMNIILGAFTLNTDSQCAVNTCKGLTISTSRSK